MLSLVPQHVPPNRELSHMMPEPKLTNEKWQSFRCRAGPEPVLNGGGALSACGGIGGRCDLSTVVDSSGRKRVLSHFRSVGRGVQLVRVRETVFDLAQNVAQGLAARGLRR
jgi:hypothetical protein